MAKSGVGFTGVRGVSAVYSAALCVFAMGCGAGPGTEAPEPEKAALGSEGEAYSSSNVPRDCEWPPFHVRKCERHADCASLVCDQAAANGHGRCVDEADVLYVNSSGCSSPSGGTGTRDDPYCRIRDAVTAAQSSSKHVIRVFPGFYLPFAVFDQRLRIFGPAGEGGIAQVFEEDQGAFRAGPGADVLLDGFALGGPTASAVRCSAAADAVSRVVVRRSTLRTDVGIPVSTVGCDIHLDRTVIESSRGAIEFTDTRYRVTNTFITGSSERIAITVRGGEGSFRFVTVSGNYKETTPDGPFDCGDSPVLIQDSIVFGNRVYGDTGTQFRGACLLERVVVGSADSSLSPGAIHEDPVLEDGYRLPYGAANLDCCIDRAAPGRAVRWDIEGTRRPQGPRSDIGAYEVVRPGYLPRMH